MRILHVSDLHLGRGLAAAEPARRPGILLAGDVGGAVRVVPLAPQVARSEVPGAGAPKFVAGGPCFA